jgi:IS5 family transposase
MEKNIAHPTDARLYERARRKLVGLAREAGIRLRQNYNRLGPRLCGQVGRYAHARQFKRMRKALRRLKGHTGRVLRDIERQMDKVAKGPLKTRVQALVALTNRLLAQKPKDRQKLYSLHEPAVDCISKDRGLSGLPVKRPSGAFASPNAHKRYEFGTKVSVATTTTGGFVVGMRAMSGNPYDGHTLHEALEQVEILTDRHPDMAFVDRSYCGHGVETVKVFISGARRGVTRTIAKLLRRRSAIEPMIGHMKTDGRLTRCPLKGTTGDALFAVPCGCGHNIRMILRHLRVILYQLIWMIALLRGFPRGPGNRPTLQIGTRDRCSG